VALELASGSVIADTINDLPCLFLPHLRHAEDAIATTIRRLQVGRSPWPAIDAEKAIGWVGARLGVTSAPGQRDAVVKALSSTILISPGVGKTTIIRAILTILRAKGVTLLPAAPTGRAAKRLTETTGLKAKTIHRLLEFDPKGGGFVRCKELPLECDLLVRDETCMIDVALMASVLKALPQTASLLIVGDVDQLPSVGPDRCLPT
jgi:exodeoxyribonuclease V alpha subunit